MIKQEADKVLMCRHYNRNSTRVECENKSDTGNKRDNWNHLSIIQTLPEQHTGKAQNQETTKQTILGTALILRKVLLYKYKT